MAIWALSDLHLSFGAPSKSMEVFGPAWKDYSEKIKREWQNHISSTDLILVAGDISWGMNLEQALKDLLWIDALPGTKVIIKGNHDYWWDSPAKMKKSLPPSIHFIQNNSFDWNGVSIGGSRLWDTSEYNFNSFIEFADNPRENKKETHVSVEENEKIFLRELERLRLSLKTLNPQASTRIAMTHYPPISADLKDSKASLILEEFNIDICVFGHLHSVKKDSLHFGEKNKIKYLFTSCDYLDFIPLRIL